ncbi:SDR family NAD(P)-dependent oxidoreductase [Paenibacillus sp. NAIST15-1]|uniref:SDR family NAD(P)-dependent oxidoreductase n=1 Tax=Paenibacillus sp. NAIST15-1 TaxID=1605994 RepID=UPI00086BE801|nr:SDR family NAD(P)-dependent oxidoreductase [Paenibacillus sp. NAIST15-1]GAV11581.1 hypothetical protein PBN151_1510 [Paenibacillus sp. NAIST15-1]
MAKKKTNESLLSILGDILSEEYLDKPTEQSTSSKNEAPLVETQPETLDKLRQQDEERVEIHVNHTFHEDSLAECVEVMNMEDVHDFGIQRSETPWFSEQRSILEQVKKRVITAAEGYRHINELLQKYQGSVNHLTHSGGELDVGYFQEEWIESEPDTRKNAALFHRILFFDTDGLAGDALAVGLKMQDSPARVMIVRPGSSFRELGPDLFEVNPVVKEDYQQLVQIMVARNIIPDKIIHWWSRTTYGGYASSTLQQQLDQGVFSLLYITQSLMEQKLGRKVSLDYVYSGTEVQPQYAAVNGFVKTLHLENPDFAYKTVGIQNQEEAVGSEFYTAVAGIIAGEIGMNDIEVRYNGKRRLVKQYRKLENPDQSEDGSVRLKDKGIYLITGGAGGLGLVFAEYLAQKVAATFILIGRSELTVEKNKKIQKMGSSGSEIIYIPADISSKTDVDQLISQVKSRFYRIDGIIHSAGIYQNGLILKKSKEEMDKVLDSKIWGTVYLDEALRDERLDFFIVCSSLAGEFGKVGQSDYAFGNSFLDHFVKIREQFRKQNKRHGKAVSINWPLWEEGGMTLEREEQRSLWEQMGMKSLPTREGLASLDFAMRYDYDQIIVTYGDQSRIFPHLSRSTKQPETPQYPAQQTMVAQELYHPTEALLKEILVNEIGLSADKLDSSTNFEKYGIDSIVVNRFNAEIEKKLGALPKTLLFEYHSVNALTEYLVKNQTAKLAEFFGATQSGTEHTGAVLETRGWKALTPISFQGKNMSYQTQTSPLPAGDIAADGTMSTEIAIIGLNGRYPGANDLEEFWTNLTVGKDSITEIPPQRWDLAKYYDSNFDNVKEGKMYCKWGGFIEDFDKFEPLFFNISPREAEAMDPQERIFLETVWATLEDAGYSFNKLRKLAPKENGLDVGVFVGATSNTYPQAAMEEWANGNMVTFSSSPWSIANRISYVFNFHGPSMPIDTACSSSLIAIHLACESLRNGECSLAVAGGVNLYLHPSKYVGMSQAKMLSPTGICSSFGDKADGMVPGEGVGAVLLKPLHRAVADQDHIYAVIKGSAVNHGGKTNGYSVPNPNAQARLLLDAFQKSGVDPLTISYIEAHGTGTTLGDPIEIAGLTKAVRHYTDKKHFCAIGSVKSNIGHLESAAGIAGLTKILLQMKYRQLLPSIHTERLNPNIDFENSPFFVQRKLEHWTEPEMEIDNEIKTCPRRAGISSFGAGGSNAHLLLEEYSHAPRDIPATTEPQLFLLSAKNEARIKQYAKRLREFLQATPIDLNPADVAYTLQVGREPMEERLAIVATEVNSLIQSLTHFLEDHSDPAVIFWGNWKRNKETQTQPSGDHLSHMLKNRELHELGRIWAQGTEVDWLGLYSGVRPRIVSLPTYPFDGKRYWLSQTGRKTDEQCHQLSGQIHPLVHRNHSTLEEQKFSTTLTGMEFFTEDHRVNGRKVLPGVAYIEMALTAGKLSSNRPVTGMRNLVWIRPAMLVETPEGTQPFQLNISLYGGQDEVKYQVWSGTEPEKRILHVQGGLVYANPSEPLDSAEFIDLDALKNRLFQSMDDQSCYQLYEQSGLRYGTRFRAIRKLYYRKSEVLADLELPAQIASEYGKYQLNPALMDGALQSIIALKDTSTDDAAKTYVPFELNEVRIYGSLPRKCYAHVIMQDYSGNSPVRRYNVQIADETGKVLVSLKNFSFRVLEQESREAVVSNGMAERLYFQGQWKKADLGQSASPLKLDRTMVVFDTDDQFPAAMQQVYGFGTRIIHVKPGRMYQSLDNFRYEINPDSSEDYGRLIVELQQNNLTPDIFIHRWSQVLFNKDSEVLQNTLRTGFYALFHLIHALLENLSGRKIQLLYLYPSSSGSKYSSGIQPQYAAVSGFVRSVHAECPDLICKVIEDGTARNPSGILTQSGMLELELETYNADEMEIRYDDTGRWVKEIREFVPTVSSEPVASQISPFKPNGVYLITGGAGGLGLNIANCLARHSRVKLVLSGRSDLDAARELRIREMEDLGAEVIYVKADISKSDQASRLVQTVKSRFGTIHGVIHCAGVIHDNSIRRKTLTETEKVLAPKVFGTIFLDEALVDETLDFFVMFSSLAAVTGNPGQSDYAFANGFIGQYAAMRSQEPRLGKVLAIHWPLWEDGGMKVNDATAAMLRGAVGMKPINAASGFQIMMEGLGRPESEITVIEGDSGKIRRFFSRKSAPVTSGSAAIPPQVALNEDRLLQRIQRDFATGVADILKISPGEIDIEADLSEFGFDSVTFTQYSNLLNERFNLGIMPSDLFEFRSLISFSKEMLARYQTQFLIAYENSAGTASVEEQEVLESIETVDPLCKSTIVSNNMESEQLLLNIQRDLLAGVVKILKISEEDVDVHAEMSEFGFDSVTFTQFSNLLNDQFNIGVTPSLFFEHRSLDSFARAILAEYEPQLDKYYQDTIASVAATTAEPESKATVVEDRKTSPMSRFTNCGTGSAPEPARTVDGNYIAIIGMSGVMPQSEDFEEFWRNIEAERDLITEIPADRWDWKACYGDPKEHNKTNIKWGGFMKEVDKFDAQFFGISPREAEMMDPQQRIFLEVVWKTIEDAGYKASDLAGTKLGLFVGVSSADYADLLKESGIGIQAQTATGNFHSVLPNRISYLLDFHGPSEPVDTACSSSLVAIHRAVEAIRNGDCSEAIAGGINVIASPSTYITFGKAGMLCEDGRCKTFDQRANGYVRGEGAAAIFLKPLHRAIAEGDHVYGVIRGTAVNHGGHTNSLTAPNPIAQADLLIDAWRKSGLDPRRATYIEAHGTGTSLGDPIEINGLKKAFDQLYRDWNCEKPVLPHCGLGSIKTNIGHLESASGIAGIIKVLLAMQHGKLPSNIHFQERNPYIQLQDSPFYIVNQTLPWKRLQDETGTEIPRVAGVSSFGFGGVNAHIIIEEGAVSMPAADPVIGRRHVMVLSAKNTERLRAYAARMLAFFEANPKLSDEFLVNIAYTLQTGRESMDERLAWVVSNRSELIETLTAYCSGQMVPAMMQGNIRANKGKTGITQDGSGKESLNSLLQRRELTALADLWIQGVDVDWKGLYRETAPTRLSLPVYPFVKERYWIPHVAKPVNQSGSNKLHVLIDSNESTLEEQCYRKTFSGEEFFIKDHSNILPGVVYMEMLRVAGNLANRSAQVKKLKNIIWVSPIAVNPGEPKQVTIGLYPEGDQIRFEVSHRGDDSSRQDESYTVHCQGRLIYENGVSIPAQPEFVDVSAVKERCQGGKEEADAYYQNLENIGVHFGHRFKGIQAFYCNQNEALSEVGIPPELEAGVEDYLLHPTLTDGGLQTVVVWAYYNGADPNTVYLPFVLGEVELVRPGERITYVYAKKMPGQENLDPVASRYQVWLLDRQGQVVIKLTDYSVSALNVDAAKGGAGKAVNTDLICARSLWENRPLKNSNPVLGESFGTLLLFDLGNHTAVRLQKMLSGFHQVILVKPGRSFTELPDDTFEIRPTCPEDYRKLLGLLHERKKTPQKVLHLWSQESFTGRGDTLADQLARSIDSMLYVSRAYLETHPGLNVKLLYVYFEALRGEKGVGTQYLIQPQYSAVGGFAKTNRMENPNLHIKTIGYRIAPTPDSLNEGEVEWMLREFTQGNPEDIELRYQDGQRWVRTWREFIPDAASFSDLPLRERGVYLITGGTGGLGLIFAEYLAKKCRAKLVLTGRTPVLSPELLMKIKGLEAAGAEVTYISADLSSRNAVMDLISRVKHRFSGIHGIIHSAGVIRDSLIREKNLEDFEAVLAPKVYGAVYLDEATHSEQLDFFALFSSITAVTGNVGQSDYAYANSFLDGFAAWRGEQNRPGKTLSLNWPLWMNGGMQVDHKIQNMLANLGMTPISNETGLNAFETALGESMSQFVFLQGDLSKLRRLLRLEIPQQVPATGTQPGHGQGESLLPQIRKELIHIMAGILKYDEAKLKLDDNMSGIGFDSITLTELANHLNETFKIDITPALFFKHTTPGALALCLINEHHEAMARYFHKKSPLAAEKPSRNQSENPAELKTQPNIGFRSRFENMSLPRNEGYDNTPEPVAVIGMSGVMPQSDDLDGFWRNMESQQDLITEIPEDRWNWEAIYGEPNGESFQTNIKWGGFMREVDKFDPLFFGIAPRDAEMMDPQERIMIEVVWKTIWDAGYKAKDFSGTQTGMFIGVSNADYKELLIKENKTPVVTHSLLANRISYLLDIHGPSEPVDTACSSSLVAINRAVEAIQSGNCEMALAGGINIIVSPNLYVYQSASGMLSQDGRCKTFDKRANGYVRGEGAGAILLKPLHKALADGDHIYAVIKASSVNHGGHATSLTAPNAGAQADLLTDVYQKAGIDPSTVSYIETHGTGTSLGDPVEIEALKDAFRNLYQKWGLQNPPTPHCGLGAVKTNIGHLESASGIAGFLKVMLSLKYKKLPPVLHFEELNPYIKLEGSPFYIIQQTQPWEPLVDSSGQEIPRRAGISSFGIGGVNAHIVLEEHQNTIDLSGTYSGQPHIVVFSAKNQDQLQVYLRSMLDDVQKMLVGSGVGHPNRFLPSIAFTLQTGRDAMEERVALVVSSLEELVDKLQQYLQGEPVIENLFSGNTKPDLGKPPLLSEGKSWNSFVQALITEGKYVQIAQLWVTGNEIDWNICHEGKNPGRVPLPPYPFARERYWLPGSVEKSGLIEQHRLYPSAKLHPCIDRNTSTLREQKFSTLLSGDEYFLRDHVIDKHKVLPGAVYLEMARAAAEIAGEQPVAKLKNIMWVQPFRAGDDSQTLDICLVPEHNVVAIEFVTHAGVGSMIHAQGQAIFTTDQSVTPKDERINIETIKQRSIQTVIDDMMYQKLQVIGIEFGLSFRTQRYIYRNETEVLSYLELPSCLQEGLADYGLHPVLMDGALQTVVHLARDFAAGEGALMLPFSIEELEIFGPIPAHCYAYVTFSNTESPGNLGLQTFDIQIAAMDGQVVAKIQKYAIREFHPLESGDSAKQYSALDNGDNASVDEAIRDLLYRLEKGEMQVEEVNRLLEVLK